MKPAALFLSFIMKIDAPLDNRGRDQQCLNENAHTQRSTLKVSQARLVSFCVILINPNSGYLAAAVPERSPTSSLIG